MRQSSLFGNTQNAEETGRRLLPLDTWRTQDILTMVFLALLKKSMNGSASQKQKWEVKH